MIGLDWELVHDEACRWEHVVSEDANTTGLLAELADRVTLRRSIPGLEELGVVGVVAPFREGNEQLQDVAVRDVRRARRVVIEQMAMQKDVAMMGTLRLAGIQPGAEVSAQVGGLATPPPRRGRLTLQDRPRSVKPTCSFPRLRG